MDHYSDGMLFDRRSPEVRRAADSHRLFTARNVSRGDALIGTVLVSDDRVDESRHVKTVEIGGVVVHPAARGRRVAGVLTRLALLHDLSATVRSGWSATYVAHFVVDNHAPRRAFRVAGFRPAGLVDVHSGDVDASVRNLFAPGADSIRMRIERFDPSRLGDLVEWYRSSLRADGAVDTGNGNSLRVRFDEVAAEIDVDALMSRP